MSDAETRLLRVLADLRLPERWAAFVATLTPRSDPPPPPAMWLDEVEKVTKSLGLRFVPSVYWSEDAWPASIRFQQVEMRITVLDPGQWQDSASHRLAFELEVPPGSLEEARLRSRTPRWGATNRVERLVARIRDELDRPDIGAVADETWYQTYDDAYRAVAWFVELCRDVAGVYGEDPVSPRDQVPPAECADHHLGPGGLRPDPSGMSHGSRYI